MATDKIDITVKNLPEVLHHMGAVYDQDRDKELMYPRDGLLVAYNHDHPDLGPSIPPLARRIQVASAMPANPAAVGLHTWEGMIDRRPRFYMCPLLQSPRDDPFALLFAYALFAWPMLQPCGLRVYLASGYDGLAFEWMWRSVNPATGNFTTRTLVNPMALAEAADAGKLPTLARRMLEGTINQCLAELIQHKGVPPTKADMDLDDPILVCGECDREYPEAAWYDKDPPQCPHCGTGIAEAHR